MSEIAVSAADSVVTYEAELLVREEKLLVEKGDSGIRRYVIDDSRDTYSTYRDEATFANKALTAIKESNNDDEIHVVVRYVMFSTADVFSRRKKSIDFDAKESEAAFSKVRKEIKEGPIAATQVHKYLMPKKLNLLLMTSETSQNRRHCYAVALDMRAKKVIAHLFDPASKKNAYKPLSPLAFDELRKVPVADSDSSPEKKKPKSKKKSKKKKPKGKMYDSRIKRLGTQTGNIQDCLCQSAYILERITRGDIQVKS